MIITVAAGGTGGHIIPALAIAGALRNMGNTIYYLGRPDSLEEKLAREAGYEFFGVRCDKLYRSLKPSNLILPIKTVAATWHCRQILRHNGSRALVVTGGFVSGPAAAGAKLAGLPLFVQEQNSRPGITVRLCSGWAKRVYTGFAHTQYLNNPVFTGNPIKPLPESIDRDFWLQIMDLDPNKPVLLFLGGSQGSQTMNTALEQALPDWSVGNIIWQCGARDYPRLQHLQKSGLHILPFTSDLGSLYRLADMAVARAGALTLAELQTVRLPAVLIPYPHAAGNHQLLNARAFATDGAAVILEQKDLRPDSLLLAVKQVMQKRQIMQDAYQPSPHLMAAQTIAEDITAWLQKNTTC